MRLGTDTPYCHIPLLLHADDIVLISPSHTNAQQMLDIPTNWCRNWGMKVNIKKSQTVHVRNKQRPLSNKHPILDDRPMEYVFNYKYLGCWVNKFNDNTKTVEALTAIAGRSLGRIVNIFKHMGNIGYGTYCTLYDSHALLVANYDMAVWGYTDYPAPTYYKTILGDFTLGSIDSRHLWQQTQQ